MNLKHSHQNDSKMMIFDLIFSPTDKIDEESIVKFFPIKKLFSSCSQSFLCWQKWLERASEWTILSPSLSRLNTLSSAKRGERYSNSYLSPQFPGYAYGNSWFYCCYSCRRIVVTRGKIWTKNIFVFLYAAWNCGLLFYVQALYYRSNWKFKITCLHTLHDKPKVMTNNNFVTKTMFCMVYALLVLNRLLWTKEVIYTFIKLK